MTEFRFNHPYQANRDGRQYGPWAEGETVDLDRDDAAWIARDSPGAIDYDETDDTTTDSAQTHGDRVGQRRTELEQAVGLEDDRITHPAIYGADADEVRQNLKSAAEADVELTEARPDAATVDGGKDEVPGSNATGTTGDDGDRGDSEQEAGDSTPKDSTAHNTETDTAAVKGPQTARAKTTAANRQQKASGANRG